MEDFSHVIQDSASSLSAVQRDRFLIEVSSIRKLQMAIRQLIATVNDPIILATHQMHDISQEFIAIEMMLMKYGILSYRPRADEEFINSLKMRCGLRLATLYDGGFTMKFKLTEPDRHALINIPVRDGLRLTLTLQPLYVLIQRLLEMQSTILNCSLSPESVRASWQESPLNCAQYIFHITRVRFEATIDLGASKLYVAQFSPDVEIGFTMNLKFKLLKCSGSLGFKLTASQSNNNSDFHPLLHEDRPGSETDDSTSPNPFTKKSKLSNRRSTDFHVLVWNGKGATHQHFANGVKDLHNRYNPCLLVVTNSRVSANQGPAMVETLPFKDHFIFGDLMGQGGAFILWNLEEIQVSCGHANAVKCFVKVSDPPTPL